MGIQAKQLRLYVIKPALETIGLYSPAAEELVLGTWAQESHLGYWLDQADKYDRDGPAYGPGQMEKLTHDDHIRWVKSNPSLWEGIKSVSILMDVEELRWNLLYAAAMTRIHYRRIRAPLPAVGNIRAQAEYWKDYYNTHLGKGTVEEYLENWRKQVANA